VKGEGTTEIIGIERAARGVATLWLDRAEKHNALSAQMIAELHAAAQALGREAVRVVVLAEGAQFALTETRLGLIPATIGPYVAARMGAAMARRVFMSGRRFDADEAVRLGLPARAVPEAGLYGAVEAETSAGEEARKGITAFFERRKPRWQSA
tara:strand:- start:2214 stop:2675 length:462 start_codon:yes stop_codon:yes gene_type:complete